MQKKQGVITEDLRRRIKDFGMERPEQEIKEEREEQKIRHKEKRARQISEKGEKSEAADPADEIEEEEEAESLPEEEPSGARLKSRSRSPVRRPRTPERPPPARRQAQNRDTNRGGAVWGRALDLNLRIITLANQRAQKEHIENWKLDSQSLSGQEDSS